MDMLEKLIYFIISGALLLLLGATWYAIKEFVKNVNKKFDDLIDEIRNIGISSATQDERIRNINDRAKTTDTRLNDHANRIRSLEQNQAGCKNFDKK